MSASPPFYDFVRKQVRSASRIGAPTPRDSADDVVSRTEPGDRVADDRPEVADVHLLATFGPGSRPQPAGRNRRGAEPLSPRSPQAVPTTTCLQPHIHNPGPAMLISLAMSASRGDFAFTCSATRGGWSARSTRRPVSPGPSRRSIGIATGATYWGSASILERFPDRGAEGLFQLCCNRLNGDKTVCRMSRAVFRPVPGKELLQNECCQGYVFRRTTCSVITPTTVGVLLPRRTGCCNRRPQPGDRVHGWGAADPTLCR
jgi:hypothetical protein